MTLAAEQDKGAKADRVEDRGEGHEASPGRQPSQLTGADVRGPRASGLPPSGRERSRQKELGQDLDPTRRRPDDIDLLDNRSHLSRTLEYDNQPRTDRAGPSSSSFARLLTVTAARIPEGWDESVTALHGHFLQSCAWATVQERFGNRAIVGADRDWCWMGVVKRVGPLRYLYVPLGPALPLQRATIRPQKTVERGETKMSENLALNLTRSADQHGARRLGSRDHPPLDPAPGRYVHQ